MERLNDILKKSTNIAVVGISENSERASYRVAKFLQSYGYKIIPVNPNYSEVLGERCYPNLKSVPGKIDIIDVFRKSEDVLAVAQEASGISFDCFWMQLGVKNEQAKQLLESKGVFVVEDMCMKIYLTENKEQIK